MTQQRRYRDPARSCQPRQGEQRRRRPQKILAPASEIPVPYKTQNEELHSNQRQYCTAKSHRTEQPPKRSAIEAFTLEPTACLVARNRAETDQIMPAPRPCLHHSAQDHGLITTWLRAGRHGFFKQFPRDFRKIILIQDLKVMVVARRHTASGIYIKRLTMSRITPEQGARTQSPRSQYHCTCLRPGPAEKEYGRRPCDYPGRNFCCQLSGAAVARHSNHHPRSG